MFNVDVGLLYMFNETLFAVFPLYFPQVEIFMFKMINYTSTWSHGFPCERETEASRSQLRPRATKHKFLERKFRRNSRTTCYGYLTSVWLAVAREGKTRQTKLKFLSWSDRSMTCSVLFESIATHIRERRQIFTV